jgi:hypothetical protein
VSVIAYDRINKDVQVPSGAAGGFGVDHKGIDGH